MHELQGQSPGFRVQVDMEVNIVNPQSGAGSVAYACGRLA